MQWWLGIRHDINNTLHRLCARKPIWIWPRLACKHSLRSFDPNWLVVQCAMIWMGFDLRSNPFQSCHTPNNEHGRVNMYVIFDWRSCLILLLSCTTQRYAPVRMYTAHQKCTKCSWEQIQWLVQSKHCTRIQLLQQDRGLHAGFCCAEYHIQM